MVCHEKRTGKKWTFTYPNGVRSQIDFILINKKWVNSAKNYEPFNSFDTVSSDYRIITATIQFSLRANKPKTAKNPQYDWSVLRNSDISNQFKISLTNRYTTLQVENTENSANPAYKNFELTCAQTADELIPVQPKARH